VTFRGAVKSPMCAKQCPGLGQTAVTVQTIHVKTDTP